MKINEIQHSTKVWADLTDTKLVITFINEYRAIIEALKMAKAVKPLVDESQWQVIYNKTLHMTEGLMNDIDSYITSTSAILAQFSDSELRNRLSKVIAMKKQINRLKNTL